MPTAEPTIPNMVAVKESGCSLHTTIQEKVRQAAAALAPEKMASLSELLGKAW